MKKDNTNKSNKKISKLGLILMAVFSLFLLFGVISGMFLGFSNQDKVTYKEFLQLVKDGKVEHIHVNSQDPNADLIVSLKPEGKEEQSKTVYTPNPETLTFKEEMVSAGIEVSKTKPSFFNSGFGQVIIMVVLFGALFVFMNKSKAGGKGAIVAPLKFKDSSDRKTNFTNVAGIDEAKENLWEVVSYLQNPKFFLEAGIRPPSGVLLHGPSGTGKTLLARAVAGEAGVPFFAVSGSDFVEKYVGVGASRVRELFELARKKTPSIIFIDEIDALTGTRSNSQNGEALQTLNQLLVELDGFSSNSGVVVIAATNRKDMMDSAVLRPGRFDRHVEVGYADQIGRLEILKVHSRNKRVGADVDYERLSKQTGGFSGAKLEYLMNESALFALRRKSKEISWNDVQDAFESAVVGAKKKRNNFSEKEISIVAYHEAGHALITHRLAQQGIERITINPAGDAGGYVMRKHSGKMLRTERDYYLDICISMAGRVAESLIFGKENVTNGAQQDFRQASQSALKMVFLYGMSSLGALAIPTVDESMWDTLSPELRNEAQKEMNLIIQRAEKEVTDYLTDNLALLHLLTDQLLAVRTLDGELIEEVLTGKLDFTEKKPSPTIFKDAEVVFETGAVAMLESDKHE